MSVPSIVLINKEFHQSCNFTETQNVYKKILNYLNKNDNKLFSSYIPYIKEKETNEELKEKVFKWFFSLDIDKRIKITSIKNKWLCGILIQLYEIFYFDNTVHFIPNIYFKNILPDSTEIIPFNNSSISFSSPDSPKSRKISEREMELDFYKTFFGTYQCIQLSQPNNDKIISENLLINQIRFISIENPLDTIVLNKDFVSNNEGFRMTMDKFSEGKFLEKIITPYYDEQYRVYNLNMPEWFQDLSNYSLEQILAMYIEESIFIHFEYYSLTTQYLTFPYFEKISLKFDNIHNFEKFIIEKEKKNKLSFSFSFFDEIDFAKIEQNINKDPLLLRLNFVFEFKNKVFNEYYATTRSNSRQVLEITPKDIERAKKRLSYIYSRSIKDFLFTLSFYTFDDVILYNNAIYECVIKIIENFNTKNLDEIVNEINEISEDKTKKKPKKKHKKNKKGKKNIEEKENKEEKENTISNANNGNNKTSNLIKNKSNTDENENLKINKIIVMEKKTFNGSVDTNENENENKNSNGSTDLNDNTSSIENNNDNNNKLLLSEKNDFEDKTDNNNDNINNNNTDDKISLPSNNNKSNQKKSKNKKKNKTDTFFLYSPTIKKNSKNKSNSSSNNNTTIKSDKAKSPNITEKDTVIEKKLEPSKTLKAVNLDYNSDTQGSSNISKQPEKKSKEFMDKKFIRITQSHNISITGGGKGGRNSYHKNNNKNFYNLSYNNYQQMNYYRPIIMTNPYMYMFPPHANSIIHPHLNKLNNEFFSKFSIEISTFVSTVTENIQILSKYRRAKLGLIEGLIKECLQQDYHFEIIYYGSFVTNLSIECSDIDLLIKYKSKNNEQVETKDTQINISESIIIKTLYTFLVSHNKSKNIFEDINPIYTASVPVIKLVCDISNEFSQEDIHKILSQFSFESDEINKVKFDLTFHEEQSMCLEVTDKTDKNHLQKTKLEEQVHPIKIVNFVKCCLEKYPEIKIIVTILKRYLKLVKLNNSFKGGISSYSLFLLVLAFLKFENYNSNLIVYTREGGVNYAKELFHFFEFYSNINFDYTIIQPGEQNPFPSCQECHEGQLIILDPITNKNVSKSSFKVKEIQTSFQQAYDFFKQSLINYEATNLPSLNPDQKNNQTMKLLNKFFMSH